MADKKLKPPMVDRSSIVVKSSPIHGKGVFVAKPIKKGEAIIEYKGERISWKLAEKRHPHDPKDPNHTFYFSLEDGRVIDAKYGGNAARWLGCSLGGGAVRKGHFAIRSNDAIDRLRLSTYRCQGQQQGGSCSRSERKTGHVGSPHSCGLCLLWGGLQFVQSELQAVSSSAIPWWRSRASRLGSRPRKALKDSMAGRLPPASRMASR